ncbi:MAG: DNA polymerase III subunit delta' [Pseudomonadota bacterium]
MDVKPVLPWQQDAWMSLTGLIEEGRLPHGLLLEGQQGTGRTDFAGALTAVLLCAQPGEGIACGECRSCELLRGGAHSDFRRVAPAEAGKAIGIDAIRAAITFATGTASLGSRKVLLVAPAESMTVAAHNAFLKCLEEPAPGTHIILVVSRGHPIPATIRSRCQRWRLPTPDGDAALAWLQSQDKVELDGDSARSLLALAGGRPLTALDLAEGEGVESLGRLHGAISAVAEGGRDAGLVLERVAADVELIVLLDALDTHTQSFLRGQGIGALKTDRARQAFLVLDRVRNLRGAVRSGTNPNPDLVRFQVAKEWCRLWGS